MWSSQQCSHKNKCVPCGAHSTHDEDGEAVSPAVASEPEAYEVPERYDSLDVAVQTDVKTGPKTSTMTWKIDKPGASLLDSAWNPSSEPKNGRTLLTIGESLCRFYQIPEDMTTTEQVGGTSA